MQAEIVAAWIGAGASIVIAALSYVQVHRSAKRAAEEQRRLRVEAAEEQQILRIASEGWQEQQAFRAAEQARQLEGFKAELERRARLDEQRSRREEVVYRFREPLARAAYDLQSRLWNVLDGGFVQCYLVHGTERENQYVIENTVFLIAQYFAWTEIIRREIQFIDLGHEERTRDLSHLQDQITHLWSTDRAPFEPRFRIWAGEQRAIGEFLIDDGPRGPTCVGYGKFLTLLRSGEAPLLAPLREDAASLREPANTLRLISIQHALIALLNFLDPEYVRFPAEMRSEARRQGDRESDEYVPGALFRLPYVQPAPLPEVT